MSPRDIRPRNVGPPRWVQRLLTRLHPDDTLEEVEGDLDELYTYWHQRAGKTQAILRYLLNVVTVLPPFVRRRKRYEDYYHHPKCRTTSNLHSVMLRNYVKIAFRNLLRYKVVSSINIGGLATGLSISLLLLLFVFHEFSYDQFHTQAKRIYRLAFQLTADNQVIDAAFVSARFGPALAESMPEVEQIVRLCTRNHVLIKTPTGSDVFYEDKVVFADSTFFSVFSFPLLTGNPHTALTKPFGLVISQEMAHKYFGNADPVGKHLLINQRYSFEITGVLAPIPSNSSLDFTCVGSLTSFAQMDEEQKNFTQTQVGMGAYQTYLLLRTPDQVDNVAKKLPTFYERLTTNKTNPPQFHLEVLPDIYLYSKVPTLKPATNVSYLYIFLGIALLILFISLINYTNLTVAYATKRRKEVGIRRILGATSGQVSGQLLGESALISGLAFAVATLLTAMGLPFLNQLMQINLKLTDLLQPKMLLLLVSLLVTISLLSGSYPAFILTRFRAIQTLSGWFSVAGHGLNLQQILIVFQFTISVVLIVCSLVIQTQLDYVRHKPIGLQKEQVIVIPLTTQEATSRLFKEKMRVQSGVINATLSDGIPSKNNWMLPVKLPSLQEDVWVTFYAVDADFIPTMGMQLINRLPAEKYFTSLSPKAILNQAAAKRLQFSSSLSTQIPLLDNQPTEIVGIIKDFNYESLHKDIAPLALVPLKETQVGGYLSIRVTQKANLPHLLTTAKTVHDQYVSGYPFSYFFLDESFDKLYKAEDRLANIFLVFTGLAIFIACLGLFGLATFIAERRTKEIGVRKVLGASVASVVALLSTDFLKPVLLALLIASPIAWYGMHHWLQAFAYRIDMAWWMFALAGLLSVGIALLTVSFQSIKAALVNPVKSLRSE